MTPENEIGRKTGSTWRVFLMEILNKSLLFIDRYSFFSRARISEATANSVRLKQIFVCHECMLVLFRKYYLNAITVSLILVVNGR